MGFFTSVKYHVSQVIKEYFKPPAYGRGTAVPPAPIPPKLKLRDGREFDVGELFRACGKSENIRLNTEISRRMSSYQRVEKKSPTRERANTPNRKYTYEERVWLTTAPDEDIMVKYGMSRSMAMRLRAQSTYICKNPAFHANR